MKRIHELFDARLARDPERALLHVQGPDGNDRDMSAAEMQAMAAALEAELRADGVGAGDRVLVVAENCPEHVALVIACSRIGAWSCGVNARMAPGEIAGFARKADARVHYFTVGASDAARDHGRRYDARPSVLPALARSAPRTEAVATTGELGLRVAAIIFTSGTTGEPKGVMLTHEALLQFGRVSAQSRDLGEQDRTYAYLPMTHIFGLGTVLTSSLYAGASLLMRRTFDPAQALHDLAHARVSQLQGPPALFGRLLAHMESVGMAHPAAPQLKYVYTGAGPLDPALKERVEAVFEKPLYHGYGMSEYAGAVTVTRMGERRNDTSAGYLVEGAQMRIVEPQSGRDLPAGERGEIWVRGVGLTPGYFRDPEATAAVMRPGGWYASGDLGEILPDGSLLVMGRLKEMIIRSGFNVYPAEVESCLNHFPAVQRSAVIGVREADGNEEVVAFLELRQGAHLDQPALASHFRENLAPYKRPGRVVVVTELPITNSGKILKRQLHDHPDLRGTPV